MFSDLLRYLLDLQGEGPLNFVQWDFRAPYAGTWLIVAVIASAAYAAYLYHKAPAMKRRWAITLGVLRATLLVVLCALLLEPVLSAEADVELRRNVLVLVDVSESMALVDERTERPMQADAALAMGMAKYPNVEAQRTIAQARAALREAMKMFEDDAYELAHAAHGRFIERLAQAKEQLDSSTRNETRSQLTQAIARATKLTDTSQRITGGVKPSPDQLKAVSDTQAEAMKQVDNLADAMRTSEVKMSDQVVSEVRRVPRHDLAKGLVDHPDLNIFKQLATTHHVRYFTFGDELTTIGSRELMLDAMAPKGAETRLGEAIEQAAARYSGQPIGGIILLTDGASNAGQAPLEVARRLGEREVAIYPIGIGLSEPPDIELRKLICPEVVFLKDRVPLRVQLDSAGYDGRTVQVTATLGGQQVASETVALTGSSQFIELPFEPKGQGGEGTLEVTVSELEGETTVQNNRRSQLMRVIDEKIKVLYVEGKPRWEYRYLRAVLLRDHRLDVKFLMTEGDRDLARVSPQHLAMFPQGETASKFDLYILGDVPAHFFTRGQFDLMQKLVKEQGASLLMLAGARHAPGSYVDTPIAEMLPVIVRTNGWRRMPSTRYPQISNAGRQSAIMQLTGSDMRDDAAWTLVRPMYTLPIIDGAKPAATVLAELSGTGSVTRDPYPLIAWHRYGAGKSMYVGTDQLWRLRFKRGDEYHARFWAQTIQFLTLSRLLGENKRIRVDTAHNDYRTGQRVEIIANALNDAYDPMQVEKFPVTIRQKSPDVAEYQVQLEPVEGSPGLYEGTFPAQFAGEYEVVPGVQQDAGNTATFRVESTPLEQLTPSMQRRKLQELAETSGGQYFDIRDVPAIPEVITGSPRTVRIRRESQLWSLPVMLALVVLLASGEWFARRKMHQL